MNAQELLTEISDYCRHTGLAESTFGRRAVNDGKLAAGCATAAASPPRRSTAFARFMQANPANRARRRARRSSSAPTRRARPPRRRRCPPRRCTADDPQRNFRFFDNRQKYLLFVNTCSEKWVVANRVAWSSRTSIRGRRRCGCSTPASATAPCWCG